MQHADVSQPASSSAPAFMFVADVFRTLTALRGRRFFHPYGVAFDGTIVANEASAIVAPGRWSARVRISRGAGVPEPLPDVHGLAIRVLSSKGPHDILLATVAGGAPLPRRVLMPTRGINARFASLLPFDTAHGRRMIGATNHDGRGSLEWLRADNPFPHFEIVEADPAGEWYPSAILQLNRRLSDDAQAALRFDPFLTPGPVEPAGYLNGLRRPVYRESQRVLEVPPSA